MKRAFLGIAALTILAFTAETANAQVVGGFYSSKVGNNGRLTVGFGNGWGYAPAPWPVQPGWGNHHHHHHHHGHRHWGVPVYPAPATRFYYSTPGYQFYYSTRPSWRYGW